MAVHDNLPGIEVSICMDGEVLKEYPDENDEVKHDNPEAAKHQTAWTVTRWIESADDKIFNIGLSVKDPYKMTCSTLQFRTEVDGHWIESPILPKADYHKTGKNWSRKIDGALIKSASGLLIKQLTFTRIQSTSNHLESKEISKQIEALSQVGQITVKVYRNSAAKSAKMSELASATNLDYSKEYHHKAVVKGGKSHGSMLGATKPALKTKFWRSTHVDGNDFPILIVKFKYHSKKALQELMVIPRSPSPEPITLPMSPSKPKSKTVPDIASTIMASNEFSPGQKLLLATLLDSLKAHGNVKSEGSASAMKREASEDMSLATVSKKPKKAIGKVIIDLTDDEPEDSTIDLD